MMVFRKLNVWAVPGGSAIPGQPATEVEQAPSTPSFSKNQFNLQGHSMSTVPEIKLIRTEFFIEHLFLQSIDRYMKEK